MSKKVIMILLCSYISVVSLFSFSDEEYREYLRLNDEEQRLEEYKDSPEIIKIKLQQLDYINASRKKYGARPVELDILASRVANRMCREAAEQEFTGHWNTRGEKPYHRYAFAGGLDHVIENASAIWSSANLPAGPEDKLRMMKQSHDRFMAEVAPYDGHKQAVIDKNHNYVGLGCWVSGGQFRYYEEYLDRYLQFDPLKTVLKVNEESRITVKPLKKGHYVYAALCYYEAPLKPESPSVISKRGGYSDYSNTRVFTLWPWDLKVDAKSGKTTIPVKFDKEGLYYIIIYVSNTKYTSGRVTTAGKIPGSGIVIEVTNEEIRTGSDLSREESEVAVELVEEVEEVEEIEELEESGGSQISLVKSEIIKENDATALMQRVKRVTINNSFKCYNIKVTEEEGTPVAYLLAYDSRIKSCGYRYLKVDLSTYKATFVEPGQIPVKLVIGSRSRVDLDSDGQYEEVEIAGNGHDSGLFKVSSGSTLLGSLEGWGNVKSELRFVDLDGDGKKEIIVGDIQDTSIHIFGYDSAGKGIVEKQAYIFSGYSGFGRVPSLGLGDIDGDSKTDLLIGVGRREHGSKSGLYSPRYGWLHLSSGNDYVTGIDTFDLNGDGRDEIIFTTFNSKIYIYSLK